MKLTNRKLTEAVAVSTVNIQAGSLSNRVSSVEQVLDNMGVSHGTGLLLAGSTGIGKTTFIKQVGKILGMSIILIEAPHITEEHLINIPFITFKPQNQKKDGSVQIDLNNFDVSLAKSHLASELKSSVPLSDQEYLRTIQNSDDNTKSIYKELGGEVDKIPDEISAVRHQYKVILFLDEYFRQTSANVRNILRGILNGRIGNDRIPPQVYVIYASNLSDTGSTIEQIPLNADFKVMDFKAPTKDEFFHYFISRFQKSSTVKLDPIVINSFYKALDDTHISHDDVETGVRTSPRRWEQLLLYVNASLPIDSKEKAGAVLANVKANFSSEEETSTLYKVADDIVREIIEKTGNVAHKNVPPNEAGKWRQTLENQIETKMKLGNARTYIPIVMGMPGIGKTAQMASIANDLNLRLISIDASTLSTDDITGIPIPGKEEGNLTEADNLAVRFAEPALYQRIMTDIKEADDEFMSDPHISKEKKAAYQSQKFKYLIFFDELNRVSSPNVFNSLRRVILEKSFNDKLKLPDSAIIVAAMNPGDKGTAELTSHLKDAVDLIDAHPDWPSFVEWLQSYSNVAPNLKNYSAGAKDIAFKVVNSFANTLTIKRPMANIKAGSMKFYVKIQDQENMYISPREYWTMYADLVAGISRALKKSDFSEDTLYKAVLQKLDSTLKWIMQKHEIDSPHFLSAVADWLKQEMDKLMIKKRGAISLESMLDDVMKDSTKHLKDDQDFTNYVQNFDLNKFSEEIDNYFEKILAEEHKRYEALSKNVVKVDDKVKLKNKLQHDLVSKIEYILTEIEEAVDANNVAGDVIDGMHDRIMNKLPSLIEDDISDDVFNELLQKVNHIFDPDRRK